MKIFYFLFFSFIARQCFSQTVTFEYLYHTTDYFKDSFEFPLQNTNFLNLRYKEQVIQPIKKSFGYENGFSKSSFSYLIADTSTMVFGDGFGHQIILFPKDDTIKIIGGAEIETFPLYTKDSFLMPWSIRYDYVSKYRKIYSLNDSLDMVGGSPFFDRVGYKNIEKGYDIFFDKCTVKYSRRLQFLNEYCQRNDIPTAINEFVTQEIKCAYILNLLQVFMAPPPSGQSYDNIPKNLLDSINTFDFNNDRYFHRTRLYPKTVLQYVQLYLRWKAKIKNDDLPGIYNIAKTTLNSQIKDFVISQVLNSYTKRNNIYFDSLLHDFKRYSKDTNSIFYLDSVRNILKGNSDEQFLKALKTSVENNTGSSIILEDIFEKKPIIIDCWASWCKPCLDEEPYMKKLMKEYQEKVQFIFLSFDRVRESWIMKSEELNLGKYNYILPNEFDNYFSYFFNIAAIPRYIIFDKKRKLIYKDSPRPSQQKELKKIFDKLLEE